jgi:spore germination cell wall hydrolase CwlJ-like protein
LAPAVFAQDIPVPVAPEARSQAIECLALAIGHEAGFEPIEGQRAVAEVVLNRVRLPGYPKTVCDVVFQGSTRHTGCQFTFTCDGALRRRLPDHVPVTARAIATAAIDRGGGGTGDAPGEGLVGAGLVGGATHYHAYFVTPRWSGALTRVTQIGAHIFYRRPGAGALVSVTRATIPAAGIGAATLAPSPAVFAPWGLAPPIHPPAR